MDVSLKVLMFVSVFSLAWLVVGVLLGQRIPRRAGRPGRSASSNRPADRHMDNGIVELYVGNLSYDVSEKDLKKTFNAFGDVVSIRLITNKFNGKSKGYGFVEMSNRSDSEKAVKSLNNSEIKGRRIIVNEAKSSARN